MEDHRDYFMDGVAQLYKCEDFADLTIICGDTKLKVHRVIVCPQARFFKSAIKGPGFLEGIAGTIELSEDAQICFLAMMEYLYTGTYTIPDIAKLRDKEYRDCYHAKFNMNQNKTCSLWPFGFSILMYTMGDKYNIPGLRTKSCTILNDLVKLDMVLDWENKFDIWEMAYQKSCATDSLRSWLVQQICNDMLPYDGPPEVLLQVIDGFYTFVERSPGLALPLLLKSLEHIERISEW